MLRLVVVAKPMNTSAVAVPRANPTKTAVMPQRNLDSGLGNRQSRYATALKMNRTARVGRTRSEVVPGLAASE